MHIILKEDWWAIYSKNSENNMYFFLQAQRKEWKNIKPHDMLGNAPHPFTQHTVEFELLFPLSTVSETC